MALTRRAKPKAKPTQPPEPDPQTVVGKEPVNVAGNSEPMLGKCKRCKTHAVHSNATALCYNCGKEAEGLTFDAEQNRFIKKRK